jgi:hypothetical protein
MTRTVHYVLSTHWDREWYQTFQDFRSRLVKLVDNVLAGWADERLQGSFQTDGQAIILEDYLEIRPEKRAQIEELVKQGKFKVGPWYVLPDEFLVSGESLVRNLRLGREIARKFGAEPSSAGFLCDMFGHNSQMPQIFNGFGIRGGFIWRGTNLIDQRRFLWKGADGTLLPTYRFGEVGYCTYAVQMRCANAAGVRPTEAEFEQNLDNYLANEAARTDAGPLLAFDGGDHMEWDPLAYAVIAKRFDKEQDGYCIIHSTLDGYLDEMLPGAGQIQTVIEGELRDPASHPDAEDSQWLIPGVTSSRVNLKLANAACQDALCQWAEPLGAFAQVALGLEYPHGYLDVAWRWLLQNHPHDSICGCSIDAVHEDMMYRFHQSKQIADRIVRESMQTIAASVDGEVGDDEVRVCVFNPLPVDLVEVVDLDLDLPLDWPVFNEMSNLQSKIAFRIYGPDGDELAYQRTAQQNNRARMRVFATNFPQGYSVNMVRVSLPLRLPALGYITLTVRPGEPGKPTRHPMKPSLVASERALENQFLRVQAEPDGTLTITDRRSGQMYQRLLTFEDSADIGDGWNHGPAISDAVFLSPGCHTSISLVHQGRFKATLRVRSVMDVPEEFDFGAMARSERLAGLVIDSYVTLREFAERVEVETVVHNNAKDHRLRVLFPSGAQTDTYLADTPFDVVRRKIALRADNHAYREPEIEPKPQQSFSAVFDGARGLSVVSSGLLEAGVVDQPERPLALTLFRATRQTVGTNGEPGGQMQGELCFRYWIVPFSGEAERAGLGRYGQMLAGGFLAAQLFAQDAPALRKGKVLSNEASFLRLDGSVLLTSLRRTQVGLEARVYNPNEAKAEAIFDFSGWPSGVKRPATALPVNLESKPIGRMISLESEKVAFELAPKQILTVCFQWEAG